MPLTDIQHFENGAVRGCWHITEQADTLISTLPAWEVAQLKNNKPNPQKLLESLAARALVQDMTKILGLGYEGLAKTPEKAPYFPNIAHKVSISHTAEYAMAILHSARTVGIDLEQARPQLQRIASRMMSVAELDFAQNELSRLALLWSAKETLYKIYAKGQLHFTRDMAISPFLPAESGSFETFLFPQTPQEIPILMHYEQLNATHFCTWATLEMPL